MPDANIYASSCRYKWNSWNRHTDHAGRPLRSAGLAMQTFRRANKRVNSEERARVREGKANVERGKIRTPRRERSDARLKKEGGKALWAAGICMASPLLSPTIKADRNPALLPPCIAFAVAVVVVTLCRRLIFILCTVTTTIAAGLGIIECASVWRQRDLIPLPRHKRKLRHPLSLKREGSAITETIGLEEGVAISSYRSRLWRRGTRDEKKDATQRDRNVSNLIQFDEAGSAFCWHEQMLNVRYIGDSLIRSSF